MLTNNFCFGAMREEQFLEGCRILPALEKRNSSFLRNEFRRECHSLLEEFVTTILSLVAARSLVAEGLTCFASNGSSEVITIPPFTSLSYCWIGCLSVAGLGSLIWRLGTVNYIPRCLSSDEWRRAPSDHVLRLTACSDFSTSLVFAFNALCTKLVSSGAFESNKLSYDSAHLLFSGLPIDKFVVRGPSESHLSFTVSLTGVTFDHEEVITTIACVQDVVCNPLFTQRKIFSETGIN